MFFVSSERRQSSRAFDKFVQHGNEVLTHPAVIARLGTLASELLVLTNSAFLPNLRHGEFRVPKAETHSDNVALIPLTEGQAEKVYDMIGDDLLRGHVVRQWTPEEAVSSNRYGISVSIEELDALRQPVPKPLVLNKSEQDAITSNGLSDSQLGRMSTSLRWGNPGNNNLYISRPRVMIRSQLLDVGPIETGAVLAHEFVHAQDVLEDGWLFNTTRYGGATESRAYHVCAEIYDAMGSDSPMARWTMDLDEQRKQRIGNIEYPFTPDDGWLKILLDSGALEG